MFYFHLLLGMLWFLLFLQWFIDHSKVHCCLHVSSSFSCCWFLVLFHHGWIKYSKLFPAFPKMFFVSWVMIYLGECSTSCWNTCVLGGSCMEWSIDVVKSLWYMVLLNLNFLHWFFCQNDLFMRMEFWVIHCYCAFMSSSVWVMKFGNQTSVWICLQLLPSWWIVPFINFKGPPLSLVTNFVLNLLCQI
jgi:hypothetical protein